MLAIFDSEYLGVGGAATHKRKEVVQHGEAEGNYDRCASDIGAIEN